MANNFSSIAVAGDTFGINQLLDHLPHFNVKCIIAASMRPQYISELNETAASMDIPILIQPPYKSGNYEDFVTSSRDLNIDLLIANSYSMLIRKDILKLVNYNAVNVHWALLPRNRGPNPVQWSIIHGEKSTGVTVHYLDDGIDSGDIIAQKEVGIEFTDTWLSLKEKLITASDELLRECLPSIIASENSRTKQDEAEATQNPRLNPDSPRIDLETMSDADIYNLIRAQIAPLQGAYLEIRGAKQHFRNFISYKEIPQIRDLNA